MKEWSMASLILSALNRPTLITKHSNLVHIFVVLFNLHTVPGTQACSSVRQFHFYGEAKDVTGAKLVTSLFPNPVNLCTFILSLQGESKMIIMGNELIQGHVDAWLQCIVL